MAIDHTLPVPLVNQLREPTLDGQPDENAPDNCLYASTASALMGLFPGSRYDGDAIKDAVMGQGYRGFGYFNLALTAYLLANHVTIGARGGNLAALAHSEIAAGVPCLGVIPSQWGSQPGAVSPNFSTHVVLLVGTGAGWLRAMNPWGGFWHDNTDQWWASRLCYGAIWPLTPVGGSSMGVPQGWHDDGTTLTAPNGVKVIHGFRSHILAAPVWNPALVPLTAEYGAAPGVRQDFGLQLVWDAASNAVSEAPGQPPAPPAPPAPPTLDQAWAVVSPALLAALHKA